MSRLWIARDSVRAEGGEGGRVYLFTCKPVRSEERGIFLPVSEYVFSVDEYGEDFMALPDDMFPDLTYENSPMEVELTLIDPHGKDCQH